MRIDTRRISNTTVVCAVIVALFMSLATELVLRQVRLEETTTEKPDLRVRCDANLWAKVFMRETDVRQALIDRRLVLEGDKSLFTRLDRLFPPPSD